MEQDYPNPVASTGFAVIRAADGVSPVYLFFQILSEEFLRPLHALQSGSSYPAVRARDVFARPVLLPPAREQERIAAKLTDAFAALQRADAAAKRALDRLNRYRAAVLSAAAAGNLTRGWREARRRNSAHENQTGNALRKSLLTDRRAKWEVSELERLRKQGRLPKDDRWKDKYREPVSPIEGELSKLPQGWTWATIDQLSWASGYGTSVRCTVEGKGPAVLRIPNIRNRSLDLTDLKFAANPRTMGNIKYLAPGDFLVIRTNGSRDLIGRAAVVGPELKKRCGFASYLIRFQLVGNVTLWSWLALAWDSALIRAHIEAKAKTTAGQYNVSLSNLSGIAIPIPPPTEQAEILREVERRILAADQLEETLRKQHARALATRQSLLDQALAGRLVPHDPSDEAVSLLLDRVRVARDLETQKPKEMPMRKTTSRSKGKRVSLLDVLRAQKKPITPEQLFREANFEPSEVDLFYRELNSLRHMLRDQKQPASQAKLWPARPYVLLQLKEGATG